MSFRNAAYVAVGADGDMDARFAHAVGTVLGPNATEHDIQRALDQVSETQSVLRTAPGTVLHTRDGLVISGKSDAIVDMSGTVLVASTDSVPLTVTNCRRLRLKPPILRAAVNTTGAALHITGGTGNTIVDPISIQPGGGRFQSGVLCDQAIELTFWQPTVSPFAISPDGVAFHLMDTTRGSYPPTAIDIYSPNLGGGRVIMLVENAGGVRVYGGTIEDNTNRYGVHIKDSMRVKLDGVHLESPSTSANVRIERSHNCILADCSPNRPYELRSASGSSISGTRFVSLDADEGTSDTTIMASAMGDTALEHDLGSRTVILGSRLGGNVAAFVMRNAGSEIFRIGSASSDPQTLGNLSWGGGTGAPDVSLLHDGPGQLRTPQSFSADTRVRSAHFASATPPKVSGAKGGNDALASLIAQLAALGLIVDGTS